MPILVDHSNAGLLGSAAYQAGNAEGLADLTAQLRNIGAHRDAQILEDQQRQRQIRNRQPSFYERAQADEQDAQNRNDRLGGDTGVQTFVNDQARAEKTEREQIYGNPAQADARKSQAQLFLNRAKSATDPDIAAANEHIAKLTLTGQKVDDFMMKAAGFKTGADVAAAAEEHRKIAADESKAQLERDKLAQKTESDAAKLAQKGEAGSPQKFRNQAESDAHEIAWKLPAAQVADKLKILAIPEPPAVADPLTGKVVPNTEFQKHQAAAVTIQRMLDTGLENKSLGEVVDRVKQLEAAGAPPQALAAAKQHIEEVFDRAAQVSDAAAHLARDAAKQVAAGGDYDIKQAYAHQRQFLGEALKKNKLSARDYGDYLSEQERQRGLRPPN